MGSTNSAQWRKTLLPAHRDANLTGTVLNHAIPRRVRDSCWSRHCNATMHSRFWPVADLAWTNGADLFSSALRFNCGRTVDARLRAPW